MAAAVVSLLVFGAGSVLFETQALASLFGVEDVPSLLMDGAAVMWQADASLLEFLPNFYLQVAVHCMTGMAIVYLVGKQLLGYSNATAWYLIHTLVNALIVILSWDDLVFCFTNPMRVHEGFPLGRAKDTMSPIIALHVFHLLAMPCTTEDYIHHGVSVGGVGGIGCAVKWGRVLNATNFFICGLPGGVDYFLLFLVKLEAMAKITEKRLNTLLNLLIRWPGIVLCMFTAIVSKHHRPDSEVGWIPIFLVALLHGGNAAFYAQKVTGNYWVTHYKMTAETGAQKQTKKKK